MSQIETNTINSKNAQYIFHVDMDAYYVSVECLLNPELKGKAVVVGHDSPRSVISASSYEARKYGVFSAMSAVKAKQLCPHLIFAYSGREHYVNISRNIMNCLRNYSPLVEVMGIDEAYMDVTGIWQSYNSPYEMAQIIQKEIFEITNGLTCSIGIAPLRFLAKIASDLNKPHGIAQIQQEEVLDFLKAIDLYKIPFVGKKFLEKLHKFGIYTGGDAQKYSLDFFERTFGKAGVMLFERVNGIDLTPITPYHEPKSESAEITLSEDTKDKEELKQYLKVHAERIAFGLRKMNKKASVINIKVKYKDFTQLTRQISLPTPTYQTQTIYEIGCHLLDKLELKQEVRLIGLGASQFDAKIKTTQLSLLDELNTSANSVEIQNNQAIIDSRKEKQREKLDTVLDEIKAKYGKKSIQTL